MRVAVRVAMAVFTLCSALLVGMASASAQDESPELVGVVDILQVSGLIDPIQVSSIEQHLVSAAADEALALVIQLNSAGVVVSDERYAELLDKIDTSSVPVGVWVGESGASVTGLSVLLTLQEQRSATSIQSFSAQGSTAPSPTFSIADSRTMMPLPPASSTLLLRPSAILSLPSKTRVSRPGSHRS